MASGFGGITQAGIPPGDVLLDVADRRPAARLSRSAYRTQFKFAPGDESRSYLLVGDGRESEGLGVIAQRKGAKAVMATLWPVADAPAS